jgi:C4-dicarboxylate-specific signal transduction histidine kinase
MPENAVSTTTLAAPARPDTPKTHGSLDADIIIKNVPDPVFVSDLEGKILSANDAVYELLGFRTDEVLEQSLARFISPEETREFTAALREVQLHLLEEEVLVLGNAIQLEQVFINLLTNARDAIANAERKIIAITCTRQANIMDICLCDTSPGIPAGLEQRIFDPFFTTKEVGAGTGLGLSITYGTIKEHQGTIAVENRPDEGALFLIQLPLEP